MDLYLKFLNNRVDITKLFLAVKGLGYDVENTLSADEALSELKKKHSR
jgi:hypothetical protein